MSSDAIFDDRRKALEESFFHAQDKAALDRMRAKTQQDDQRAALQAASGVTDEKALDRLIELGVAAETLAAVGLVPLVAVAWADGEIDSKEREAVLAACREAGINAGSPAFAVVERWLETRPKQQLVDTWLAYTRALVAELPEGERAALEQEVLGRARHVAEAAGGFLGLGQKVSEAEARMLDELKAAFHGAG